MSYIFPLFLDVDYLFFIRVQGDSALCKCSCSPWKNWLSEGWLGITCIYPHFSSSWPASLAGISGQCLAQLLLWFQTLVLSCDVSITVYLYVKIYCRERTRDSLSARRRWQPPQKLCVVFVLSPSVNLLSMWWTWSLMKSQTTQNIFPSLMELLGQTLTLGQ